MNTASIAAEPGRAAGANTPSPGSARVRQVAVADEADEVRRREHVEVQVRHDARLLRRAQVLDEVGRADEPVLLGAPERERDLVGQLDRAAWRAARRSPAASAVPEPLSLMPGPAATESRCAPSMTFLRWSPLRLSAITLSKYRGVVVASTTIRAVGFGVVSSALADLVGGEHGRDRVVRRRLDEQRVRPARVALVVEDHADRARIGGERQLLHERARAALDQRDRALGLGRVVLRGAAGGRRRRRASAARRGWSPARPAATPVSPAAENAERDEVDVGRVVVGLGARRPRLRRRRSAAAGCSPATSGRLNGSRRTL